jgi:nitroreductase
MKRSPEADPSIPGPGASSSISRRTFIATAGGAAAYLALRPTEAWARNLARPRPVLQPWALPAQPPADPIELCRALIGAAVLAPSHWNTQPWRMEANGTWIRLLADSQRALPVTDPDRTAMMLSLGAALENMVVAMRAYGLRPAVSYFPDGEKRPAVASLTWMAGEPHRDRDLFLAIPERRTNRLNYDGRGLFMQNRAALSAMVSDDLRIHWLDDRDQIARVADLVHEATRDQVLDPRSQAEHYAWMRAGDDEARERGDGVTLDALEINGPAHWFAGRYFNPRSRFLGLGAGTASKQAREAVKSAGALALIAVPKVSESLALLAGQAYERMALRATRLGIAHQPIHAPIESTNHRVDLARQFGAVGESPLMLVRLGHARAPRPSVRRGVAMVASFRNS